MTEGARKSDKFVAVCSEPDYCWTPVGGEEVLVPYMIACDLAASVSCSPNVNFTGQPVVLFSHSAMPQVQGNEPGVGGGLVSGVNVGHVWVKGHSDSVNCNGIAVSRHEDDCWMNHVPQGDSNG